MPYQVAGVHIVRSIRQVSLVRDWQRSRKRDGLPKIVDFIPNERAGDAADLLVAEVVRADHSLSYVCRSAGERVELIFGCAMVSHRLDECLDPAIARAAQPIWNACVTRKMPVYAILPLADRTGCPVTIEQLFLPYSGGSGEVDFLLIALHAWSIEGRFIIADLLRGLSKAPLHWAVIIDPAKAPPRPAAPGAASGEIVAVDQMGMEPGAPV